MKFETYEPRPRSLLNLNRICQETSLMQPQKNIKVEKKLTIKEEFAREMAKIAEQNPQKTKESRKQFTDEMLKNPLSGGDDSGQQKKFSPLKESDLAAASSPPSAFNPVIPSVSPVIAPLLPNTDKNSRYNNSKISSQNVKKSGQLQLQDLDQYGPLKNYKQPVSKSAEVIDPHNYYGKFTMSMDKKGLFTNKWYIPVTLIKGRYISPEGLSLELYKSYSSPLLISEGIYNATYNL